MADKSKADKANKATTTTTEGNGTAPTAPPVEPTTTATEGSGTAPEGTTTAPTTAPPVEAAAPVETAPPENEKEVKARAAAMEAAQAKCNKQAGKIAADWARQDKTLKTWMVEMGARCHTLLLAVCALDTPYTVAMGQLLQWLTATTGESKGADVTRCIKLFFASLVFGAEQFGKLPIRGQKEVATLLSSVIDAKSKAVTYVLTPETAETSKVVFAVLCGDDGRAVEGCNRTKEGVMDGESCAKLVALVKAGKNPLVKEEKTATDGTATATATTQPPAGGTKKEGKEGEQTATGERPVQTGAPKLDHKPALAGGELVKLLAEHDESAMVLHSAAKAKEFTAAMVEALIGGMAEAGRIDDLRHIASFVGREIRLALLMEKNKIGRIDAIKQLDEQEAKRAA